MKRSRFTEEQIIGILREHQAGAKTADLCRKHGISDATFYKWRSRFGGMEVSDARRLKTLEAENAKLKKMLAERGQEVSVMLDLDVPEEELMTRLIKRGQESGRADDNEETIKKRLVVYHSQTAPLIDWYKNEGKYQHIHGLGTMDAIFADIVATVEKL